MIDEARTAGLGIAPHVINSLTNGAKGKLHRSRKHVYRFKSPLNRPLNVKDKPIKIHPSVKARYLADKSYRPPQLKKLVKELGWGQLNVGE